MLPNPPAPEGVPVARVITRLNIGGPSIQAVRLTAALEPYGFSTVLFHGRLGAGEGDMSYLIPAGADARFVPTLCRPLSPLDDLRTLIRLYQEFRRARPRIVHTHMAKAGLLGRLAAVLYNLRRGNRPRARIVHTYHGHVLEGYFGGLKTWLFIALERLMARGSDALVAIAPPVRDELLIDHGIGRAAQYHLVPLGFDLTPFAAIDREARVQARRGLNVPDDAEVITTVGRLTAIKDQSRLLGIARELAERRPRLILLVVGDGELRAGLEAEAAAHGLGGHVRFLGWRRDLPAIYAATDVFTLTSRNEGTPVALIEAMAAGVPGVSTDVGGVATVIENETMGIRVRLDDDAGFVAGVVRLLESADREAMGARARAHVLGRFDRRRLVADIARLDRRLLEDH